MIIKPWCLVMWIQFFCHFEPFQKLHSVLRHPVLTHSEKQQPRSPPKKTVKSPTSSLSIQYYSQGDYSSWVLLHIYLLQQPAASPSTVVRRFHKFYFMIFKNSFFNSQLIGLDEILNKGMFPVKISKEIVQLRSSRFWGSHLGPFSLKD